MSVLTGLMCLLLAMPAEGRQKPPELTGTLTFDVGSASGRVESLAVQIGDGGTGRHRAILAGDPSLPTHAVYRPRDLRPFGGKLLLPIVAFGCLRVPIADCARTPDGTCRSRTCADVAATGADPMLNRIPDVRRRVLRTLTDAAWTVEQKTSAKVDGRTKDIR